MSITDKKQKIAAFEIIKEKKSFIQTFITFDIYYFIL